MFLLKLFATLIKICLLSAYCLFVFSGVLLGQGMKKSLSLLDWINQAGNSSLEQVADSCYRLILSRF